ncbi:amidohydrolase [Ruminococcaceae bacterium OttesenSCG-928-D13]|nr:amidohydrolase [Ruminococcaceae bacterium OttesenSCG-928-D13]
MVKEDAYVQAVWDKLHAMPELGMEEVKTSAYLADELEKYGYKVIRNIGHTGVLGMLDSGKPGPGFGLRADMDALPFEKDGKPYAFHACGHDAHSAMVMAAAKRLAETGIQKGKLFILFQQAEEVDGAAEMVQTGVLQKEGVEELVGVHLRPIHEAKLGQATPALMHSAMLDTTFEITGATAHGARPHLGVNALDVAATAIMGINAIHEDPQSPYSIKATQCQTVGNVVNSIPHQVILGVDIRATTNPVNRSLEEKLVKIVEQAAAMYGATAKQTFRSPCYAAEYDDELVELTRQAIVDVLGEALPPLPTNGAEDFHYWSVEAGIKTAYIGLGANLTPGLHDPEMTFDRKALDNGVAVFERLAQLRLG